MEIRDGKTQPAKRPPVSSARACWAVTRPTRGGPLPRVALEPSVGGYHVNTRRFEREFPGEDELSVVVAACRGRRSLVVVQSPPRYPPHRLPRPHLCPPATHPWTHASCWGPSAGSGPASGAEPSTRGNPAWAPRHPSRTTSGQLRGVPSPTLPASPSPPTHAQQQASPPPLPLP